MPQLETVNYSLIYLLTVKSDAVIQDTNEVSVYTEIYHRPTDTRLPLLTACYT